MPAEPRSRDRATYQGAYYLANRDRLLPAHKAYYHANKHERRTYQRAYYHAHSTLQAERSIEEVPHGSSQN